MTRGKIRKRENRPVCGADARKALGVERLNLEMREGQPAYVLRNYLVEGEKWQERACKYCGGTFACKAVSRRQFGDDKCKGALLKLRQARGLYIIDVALEWWSTRNGAAMGTLSQRLGFMLGQDRDAGRPSW